MVPAIGDVTLGGREPRGHASEHHKKMQARYLRGFARYKDYTKPRCKYTLTSPIMIEPIAINGAVEPNPKLLHLFRNSAMQKLEKAQDDGVFVCGIQPFDANDMHNVISICKGIEYHEPLEFDNYGAKSRGAYCQS